MPVAGSLVRINRPSQALINDSRQSAVKLFGLRASVREPVRAKNKGVS
jgi:hypothetical protein